MVENLAKQYGDKIAVFEDQDYYSFPHIHKLAQVFSSVHAYIQTI